MSSYDEDQLNEMEAMEAIYQADYEALTRDVPRQYRIDLSPHTDGTEIHVTCRLSVLYPPTYPAEPPTLTLSSLTGLTPPQLHHLSSLAASVASSHIGDCSVFEVTTAIRDFLLEHNRPQQSMLDQREAGRRKEGGEEDAGGDDGDVSDEDEPQAKKDARRERREAERRAMRGPSPLGIAPGTVVTVESFTRWKALFEEEQRKRRDEAERSSLSAGKEDKLTGKQLFLLNLARELQDDEAERGVEEKEEDGKGKEKLFWYSEGLYEDDDVNLPEDDEEEGKGPREEEEGEESRVEEKGDSGEQEEPDAGPMAESQAKGTERDDEQQSSKKEQQKNQTDDSLRKLTPSPPAQPQLVPAQQQKPSPSTASGRTTSSPIPPSSKQSGKKKPAPAPPAGSKGKDAKAKGKR